MLDQAIRYLAGTLEDFTSNRYTVIGGSEFRVTFGDLLLTFDPVVEGNETTTYLVRIYSTIWKVRFAPLIVMTLVPDDESKEEWECVFDKQDVIVSLKKGVTYQIALRYNKYLHFPEQQAVAAWNLYMGKVQVQTPLFQNRKVYTFVGGTITVVKVGPDSYNVDIESKLSFTADLTFTSQNGDLVRRTPAGHHRWFVSNLRKGVYKGEFVLMAPEMVDLS